MNAEIISIGDELLVGQVVNTNATVMAAKLHSIGIGVGRITAIADDGNEIKHALDEAKTRADIILLSGGLGPTRDDLTKKTLCEYFQTGLVLHEESLENIRRFFANRGFELTERNREQAEVPANCDPLVNHNGTAPGMWFESDGRIIVSMPGVPFEMEGMMDDYILPRLRKNHNDVVVVHRTVLTHGMGESFLSDIISAWEEALPENIGLAYLPQPGIVRLRLTGKGKDWQTVSDQIDEEISRLQKLIPDLIFGYEDESMEEVVGVGLIKAHRTLCTAESCTGGYIAHLITSVAGSSRYYKGSVVAYSNEIKEKILGVKSLSLEKYGAVSEEVVREMAEAARLKFGTDYAISTSGIAGPDGGTIEKPVGTVWIAVASAKGTLTQKFLFGEHRGRNIRRAALSALNMLRLKTISESSD